MLILTTIKEAQEYITHTSNIGFVPTMGGLHDGHLSLIDIAAQHAHVVIVSIFVNPAQFSECEDFDSYPNGLEKDITKLKARNVDVLFMPNVTEIYPKNYVFTYQIPSYLDNKLCATSRPHFFPGVVKVIYRLFDIIKPDIAVFGKKDFQQLLIIKQMVVDFGLKTTILSGEIVRKTSGLALSTRNNYLSDTEMVIASNIQRCLQNAKHDILQGGSCESVKQSLMSALQEYFNLDYCEILASNNLGKIKVNTKKIIILVAAILNGTRLIDNLEITRT